MTDVVILRRKGKDKTTTVGIAEAMQADALVVRSCIIRDYDRITGSPRLLVRWGCTGGIPLSGHITLNSSDAIHWCNDKRSSRLAMQAAGVPVPETWDDADFFDAAYEDFFDDQDLFVSRPASHRQGHSLSHGTATQITLYSGGYVSRLINKVAEYRVFVCQNRVVWIAKKTPHGPQQVAWNVEQGGRFDNVRWDEWAGIKRVLYAAFKAMSVGSLDFGGVDVMVDAEGNPYVLEINSAPTLSSPYRRQCTAKVFDYIAANGKEPLPDVEDSPRRTWKSFIHPALRRE